MNTEYYVDSIAALRALSVSGLAGNTIVFVNGYYGPGTDGGGAFYYSSGSSATDNGGTIVAPNVGSGRWLRIIQGTTYTPEMFGAKGDGSTDDTSAITSAIAVIQAVEGSLQFSARKYAISGTLAITARCSLLGCGKNLTYIISSSPSADIITITGTVSVPINNALIRGFGLTRSATPTGGNGIKLVYTGVARVEDVQSDASATGVYLYQATNTFLTDVLASITSGSATFTGFWLNGGNTESSVSSILTNCAAVKTSGHTGNSFGFVCDGTEVQDLKFINPETAGTAYGIYINGSSLGSGLYLADIDIINPVCDQITATGISITNGTASDVEDAISITDGWMNPAPGASAYGVYLQNVTGVSLKGMQFYADTDYANARGLGIDSCSRIIATNNTFISQQYGVYLTGTNTSCNISNNSFFAQNATKQSATCLSMTGTSRSVFSGNVFAGYATTAISLVDSSNQKNLVANNIIDPTNIANTIVNNGTGTVLANNITT